MSRKSFFERKYNYYNDKFFILDFISNILAYNGKMQFAQKFVKKVIKELQKKISENAFLVLIRVLSLVSPRLALNQEEIQKEEDENDNVEKIKITNNNMISLKEGLYSLYNNAKKRKEKGFITRLINEILDTYFGKSVSFDNVEKIEKEIIRIAELENEEQNENDENDDYLDYFDKTKKIVPLFYTDEIFRKLNYENVHNVDINELLELIKVEEKKEKDEAREAREKAEVEFNIERKVSEETEKINKDENIEEEKEEVKKENMSEENKKDFKF